MLKQNLPLKALRAFEALAQHLRFTRAGLELRVAQTAISHQVKGGIQHLSDHAERQCERMSGLGSAIKQAERLR
jgi:hypothetical protein